MSSFFLRILEGFEARGDAQKNRMERRIYLGPPFRPKLEAKREEV
jgi:hypothetical protein